MIETYASLFSGIGGLDLAIEAVTGARLAWYSEVHPYAAAVMARHWPGVPNLGFVQDIDEYAQAVDLIAGGFPCQDTSQAGKREGLGGSRSGLWYEQARVIRVLRPRFVFVENVAGLLVRGVDEVLGSLVELGFDAEWSTLRASDVGAPHERRRIFILAARVPLSDADRVTLRELGQRYRQQPWLAWSAVARGGTEALVAAQRRRGSSDDVRTRQRDSQRSSTGLVDSDSERQNVRTGRQQRRRSEPADAGQAVAGSQLVADTDGIGRPGRPATAGRQEGTEPQGSSRAVADTVRDGCQGLGEGHDDDRRDASRIDFDRCHAWPPGPDDFEGWRRDAGARPGVRRASYGPARGMGARRRRARVARCGNACVPQQAALAFAELAMRLADP